MTEDLAGVTHWQAKATLVTGAVFLFGVTATGTAAARTAVRAVLADLPDGEAELTPVLPRAARDTRQGPLSAT
jgi:hypothetical protein